MNTRQLDSAICHFKIGDRIRFFPSERTCGHYQNIEGRGMAIGAEATILRIQEDGYLSLDNGCNEWAWTEFVLATTPKCTFNIDDQVIFAPQIEIRNMPGLEVVTEPTSKQIFTIRDIQKEYLTLDRSLGPYIGPWRWILFQHA